MPPDMFYNYNEEIKRQKEQTIRSQNRQISWIRGQEQGLYFRCVRSQSSMVWYQKRRFTGLLMK